jgi:hypothetical protein
MKFDPNAESWKREMKITGGYSCTAPYPYLHEGQPRFRECGWCDGCMATQKSDHVARLAGQAFLATTVAFVTLTYAPIELADGTKVDPPGAAEFITDHTSKMIRAIRDKLRALTCERLGFTVVEMRRDAEIWARVAADMPTVVFDCWGETGPKFGRKHFHVLLFFSGNMDFPGHGPFIKNGPRDAAGETMREQWEFWSHGTSVVKVAKDQADCVAFARYCGKYIGKSRGLTRADRKAGAKPESIHYGSRGRALGSRYFESEAERTADAGLPLKGLFLVPGVLFSRSKPKSVSRGPSLRRVAATSSFDVRDSAGNTVYSEPLIAPPGYTTVRVYGAVRTHTIEAYKKRWREKHGDAPIPLTPFLERFDEEFNPDDYTTPKRELGFKWHARAVELLTPLPPYRDKSREGTALVYDQRQKVIGTIRVYDTGSARCVMDCGDEFWLNVGDLSLSLGRFIDQVQRREIELWLSRQRGPFWLSKWDRKYEVSRRAFMARAALKRLCDRHESADRVDEIGADILGEITDLARKLTLNGSAYETWLSMGKDVADSDRAAKRAQVAAMIAEEVSRDLTGEYTRSLLARLVGGTFDAREFASRSKVFRNRWNRLKRKGHACAYDAENIRPFPKPGNDDPK